MSNQLEILPIDDIAFKFLAMYCYVLEGDETKENFTGIINMS